MMRSLFRGLWQRIKRNPVLLGSVAVALAELGIDMTDEETAALAVVVGLLVRMFTTPVHDPRLPVEVEEEREAISG